MHEQFKHSVQQLCNKACRAIYRVKRTAYRIGRWIHRRRGILIQDAARGIAYKAGTVAVTLLAVWWQNRH